MRQSWAAKLAAFVLIAAVSAPASEARGQTPLPEPSATPVPEAFDALARQAMMSVYFLARYVDDAWLPAQFRPIPLDEAVDVIARDRRPFAGSRRLRAMAKLASAPPHGTRRRALQRLGAPLGGIETRLDALRAVDPDPMRLAPGSSTLVPATVAILEALIGPSIPDCDRTYPTTDIWFDYTSWESTAIGKLSVQRPLAEMRVVLDPQNWDVCGSKYFQASYVAMPNGLIDANGDAQVDPNPPAAGSAWSGVLFEHFVFDLGPGRLGSFRTLLDVASQPGPTSHQVDFTLRKSILSRIGSMTRNGGIAVDEGWAKASATGAAATDVEAKKVLKFANWGDSSIDFGLNLWVGLFLEVVSEEAYEGVCCQVSD